MADRIYPEGVLIVNTQTGKQDYYLFSSKPYVAVSDSVKKLVVGIDSGPLFEVAINEASTVNIVLVNEIPDNIEPIHCFEPSLSSNNGKYFVNGRIIIYKDGKKYDLSGKRIK